MRKVITMLKRRGLLMRRRMSEPDGPTAVTSATLEAAGSSTRGGGWTASGPASRPGSAGAARSRQAQAPSSGTATEAL
eukprot:scaffold95085_cov57-Phaeocystis_antarctica.AAC.3